MHFPPRRRLSASVAVLALIFGAAPALAQGTAPSSATRARTPLTAEIAKETVRLERDYENPDCNFFRPACHVDGALLPQDEIGREVSPVEASHADSAQLPEKLEWILGADLEAEGSGSLLWAEQNLVVHHDVQAQKRLIQTGLKDFREANFYIADADGQLGVPHRALELEPNRLLGRRLTPAEEKPLIIQPPTGSLGATIDASTTLLDERVPSAFANVSYTISTAADAFYAVTVARELAGPGQRGAQREWVAGAHLLQQGNEELGHAATLGPSGPAIRREVAAAFVRLRRANAEVARADTQLGISHPTAVATLPATVNFPKLGSVGYPGVS